MRKNAVNLGCSELSSMLHNQSQAESNGRLAIKVIEKLLMHALDRTDDAIYLRRSEEALRKNNLDKIEDSAIVYARRAFHFAALHLDLTEHRACARVVKTYKTIAA